MFDLRKFFDLRKNFTVPKILVHKMFDLSKISRTPFFDLSGHVPEIQAEVEVVKIKNPDFSCWA